MSLHVTPVLGLWWLAFQVQSIARLSLAIGKRLSPPEGACGSGGNVVAKSSAFRWRCLASASTSCPLSKDACRSKLRGSLHVHCPAPRRAGQLPAGTVMLASSFLDPGRKSFKATPCGTSTAQSSPVHELSLICPALQPDWPVAPRWNLPR